MKSKIILANAPEALKIATDVILNGGVIAIPTDTVYGVAASISSEIALERIYKIKKRDRVNSLPVLVSGMEQVSIVAEETNDRFKILTKKFWPGPLTLILNKKTTLSDFISTKETVAIRMPDNKFTLDVIALVGPLAVTSANISGSKSSVNAQEVMDSIGNDVDLIIDGGVARIGIESTIVDCRGDTLTILREGAIKREEIEYYVYKSQS